MVSYRKQKVGVFMDIENTKKTFKEIGKSMWFYFGLQIGLSFLASFTISFFFISCLHAAGFFIDSAFSMDLTMIVTCVASFAASFGTIALRQKKLDHPLSKEAFKSHFPISAIFKTLGVLLGFNFCLGLILSLLNGLIHTLFGGSIVSPDFSTNTDVFYNILLFIQTIIIAPLAEECFFRGLILRSLAKYHKAFAIIISALLFGMMHLNFAQGIPAFFAGIILAYASIKYNSLLLPILVHALNNALSVTVSNLGPENFLVSLYSVLLIACFVYACIYISSHRNEIKQIFIKDAMKAPYISLFFKQIPIVLFIILFMLYAVTDLFLH